MGMTVCAALLVCARTAVAQAPPGPLPPKPGAPVQQPPPPIRVNVDLVTTPVTVRNAHGEMVLSLEARDFRLLDNGVDQKIERFDLGGDPISAALVFETSSRIEPLLPAVRKTGIVFTQNVLGPSGQAAVYSFDDTPTLVQPLTADHEAIEQSVKNLRLGTSGARLYDSMQQAVNLLAEQPRNRRRVIILIAEATDTGSEATLGEVLRQAQLANIVIYSVGLSTTAAELRKDPQDVRGPVQISPPGTFGRPPIPGTPQTPTTEQQRSGYIDYMALLKYIIEHATNAVGKNELVLAATATGGVHIPTFKDQSIEKAVSEIGGELHAQYSLSYFPTRVSLTGHHEIEVRLARPGLKARARPGYYLPPPETP
jgi:VWFA-related protein